MKKYTFYLVIAICSCLSLSGQEDFKNIQICHDSSKALKQVMVKEYCVNIKNGLLASFYSFDGNVTYIESEGKIMLRRLPMYRMDSLLIQLTPNGILFATSKRSTFVKEIKSVATDTAISLNLETIEFPIYYHLGKPDNFGIAFGNKIVTINVSKTNLGFSWDIMLETNTDENVLLLKHLQMNPYFLSLHDDMYKTGVRLFSTKQNGVFDLVERLRKVNESYGTVPKYNLRYSQKGVFEKGDLQPFNYCD